MGVLVTSACSSVTVRTITSPDVRVPRMQTFRILDVQPDPATLQVTQTSNGNGSGPYANGAYSTIVRNSLGSPLLVDPSKPMLNNEIALEVGRASVRDALLAHGFVEDPVNPDFDVAFYASAQERLDIREYDYGYCCGYDDFETYVWTEGTVLIDLVNPDTQQLIWRGSGVAPVSDNPRKYLDKMDRIVWKIIERVPAPGPVPIVSKLDY
jgi:hypothetical protein